MNNGAVARIIDFSPVDGPGNRLVIFLQGCNLNCQYCHNPETIPVAVDGEVLPGDGVAVMTVASLLARVERARPFISGVTISGGECTVQYDFLMALCTALKSRGVHVLLDTNGQISPERLEALMPLTDGIMLDIKALNPEIHRRLTGAENHLILQNFNRALEAGYLAEVRTVVLEKGADSLDTVMWVSEQLGMKGPGIPYRISRYRPHGVRKNMLQGLVPPSDHLIRQCAETARNNGVLNVIVV